MKRMTRVASGAAALAVAAMLIPTASASAATLPIVKENRPRALQPNLLNPNPVCNAWEDTRITITKADVTFKPAGAIEMTNSTNAPVNLTQNLSMSQTMMASIQGTFGFDVSSAVKATIAPTLSYTMAWTVGQQIGPYQVPVGKTARASYGFNAISYEGTREYCKLDGTWSKPTKAWGLAPISTKVDVTLYDKPEDVLGARSAERVPTEVVTP